MDSDAHIRTLPPRRHHDLDALRAWAMSMGIVLHAAWIMIPGESGAPKTDASASQLTHYLCFVVHTFRMQLFFVMAGLFACLLLRSRGVWHFVRNRFLRVALPLAVFWYPLIFILLLQYNVAQIQSGAIQGDANAWQLTQLYFQNIKVNTFVLGHLWFLYYLCWAYVLVLAMRGLLVAMDRDRHWRDWFSDRFNAICTRPFAPFVLALLIAPAMFSMTGVIGIEVDPFSLIPKWMGLISYTIFFLVGWLIFRNIDHLGVVVRGWRWQLTLGLIVTIPFFFFTKYASQHGYATPNYPQLMVQDLAFHHGRGEPDYAGLRAQLLSAEADAIPAILLELLPEPNREFLQSQESATENQLNGLLQAINLFVLTRTELAERVETGRLALSEPARAIAALPADQRRKEQNERLNREILEAGLPGVIHREARRQPHYHLLRAAYAYCYALISWLLVFGCLGLFRTYCHGESRFWRYFSDASYWFYLAHLPIQFQILIWFGDKPWPWPVKFLVYVLGALAVLIPSYHFVVRPTWIGWLLNGKVVPIRKRVVTVAPTVDLPATELPSAEPGTATT
jgi:hypothetical protein